MAQAALSFYNVIGCHWLSFLRDVLCVILLALLSFSATRGATLGRKSQDEFPNLGGDYVVCGGGETQRAQHACDGQGWSTDSGARYAG